MKILEPVLLNQLYDDASSSERLRSHFMLHANHSEKVQRLIIAMLKVVVYLHHEQSTRKCLFFCVAKYVFA